MQVIVVSNAESLRTTYFIKAGQSLGFDTCFVSYDQLLGQPSLYHQSLIKLEPPCYEDADWVKYNLFNRGYMDMLSELSRNKETRNLGYLNPPDAILHTLDKAGCKESLAGQRVTPLIGSSITHFDELMSALDNIPRKSVFIKPRYGSGAGGIIAMRQHPGTKKLVAYTSLKRLDENVYNTKRIHRLTDPKEIRFLSDLVLLSGAVVEEWISKDDLDGEQYDLRVVCQWGKIRHIVVRCSKGVITNLHLNNNARSAEELMLPGSCMQELCNQCVESNRILGLNYSGTDILIAKGTRIPYIIEVNGQGDHIYQDMFDGNKIYREQIEKFNILRNGSEKNR